MRIQGMERGWKKVQGLAWDLTGGRGLCQHNALPNCLGRRGKKGGEAIKSLFFDEPN